ncbi:MAG TPA: ribonuclease P protein component [Methanocorpusculum sp.]|nr:ribonuclease P protein component [Methanocorpusculum sp.]
MRGTIKSSDEIERLFKTGEKHKSLGFMILVGTNLKRRDHEYGRVAYIAGKKIGNSPKRNLAKRIMRGIAKDIGLPYPGLDVVFVANRSIFNCDYDAMVSKCKIIMDRAKDIAKDIK